MAVDDDECIHGLGLKSACTICNGKDKLPAVDHEFSATFSGPCPHCGAWVELHDTMSVMLSGRIHCAKCVDA